MAFPDDAVPVVVEIAPGADPAGDPGDWTFTDVTTSVRLDDRIEIVAGRQNEAGRVDPSRCTLRLDNSSGDFTPRNPSGQWYGQLARNTPIRVRVRRVEDAFGRTLTAGWGSPDDGPGDWVGFGSGGTVNATDFTVSGGMGRLWVPAAIAYRAMWLPDLSLTDVEVAVTTDTFITGVVGGAIEPAGIMLRAQDDLVTYYMARVEIDTAEAVTIVLYAPSGTALGTASVPSITWTGQPLRVRAAIKGTLIAAKVWDPAGDEPVGWQVEATDDELTDPGGIGLRSGVAAGNTNTKPLEFRFDELEVLVDRFCGFVSSWPPRWDKSGNNATVPIQADGVLRRLGQGSPPARSALRRTIAGSDALAYWPVEDGKDTSQAASAYADHQPLTINGTVTFNDIESWTASEGYTVTYGTEALADLAAGGILTATVPGSVTTATVSGWTVGLCADVTVGAALSADLVLAEVETPGGTYVRWRLVIVASTGRTRVIAYDSGGSATTVVDYASVFTSMIPHNFAVWQSGGNIQAGYLWAQSSYWASGSVAGTLAGVTRVTVNPTATTATVSLPAGHLAVWAGHDLDVVDWWDGGAMLALFGYAWTGLGTVDAAPNGEAAHTRLARLCAEDDVRISIPALADADAETRMGRQAPGTPLDLYRQCEDADQGVLYESGFGLAYLPRDGRYNRATTLTLDFDAGQVSSPPEPVDDDQQLRNRVTVRRPDGSSATAENTTSIATVGAYDGSAEVNVARDDVLPDHASWRVHLGTVDEMRWPRIDVNLARSPELIDAVLSCGMQSRVVADNPPAEVAGDTIDVLVEGWSEAIGYKDWLVSLNASPASGWDVATADGEQRVAADGSTLGSSLTASATTLLLTSTTTNGVWTTDAADMPLDVRVGGERVTASAIASAVTDTFTRTVSGGWGTSSSGQAWSTSGGSASDYSVSSGAGRISLAVLNSSRRVLLPDTYGAVEQLVKFTISQVGVGDDIETTLMARYQDTSNYMQGSVFWDGDSTFAECRLIRRQAGAATTLGTFTLPFTQTGAGLSAWVRFLADGPDFYLRAWAANATDAGAWMLTATDTTWATGQVGVRANVQPGFTGTLPVTVTADDYAITNPQAVTLSARAVNGVARAWDAGTDVDVWLPAVAAL